jgi:hypothetical protein
MRVARFLSMACMLGLLGGTAGLSSGCSNEARTTGTLAPENEDVRKGMEASAANYLKNSPVNHPAPKNQGK